MRETDTLGKQNIKEAHLAIVGNAEGLAALPDIKARDSNAVLTHEEAVLSPGVAALEARRLDADLVPTENPNNTIERIFA